MVGSTQALSLMKLLPSSLKGTTTAVQAMQASACQGSGTLQSCCWLYLLIWCLQPASPITRSAHSPLYAPMGAAKKQVVLPESTFASPVHVGCALTTRGLYRR